MVDPLNPMHRILALWAHPRSLSTVFERIMIERGDFHVLHEPFSYVYYVHERRRHLPDMERSDEHPRSYPDVRNYCLRAAQDKPVFFKDMPYHCLNHLLGDRDFLKQLTHTFIVRDPARTIPSHYAQDSGVTLEEIGCEAQKRLFTAVAELTGSLPVVIAAEDLQRDGEGVVKAYCQAIDIPFLPEALRWERSAPPQWAVWRKWHKDVADSQSIVARSHRYETTIENDARLRSYYDHHLPFYQDLHRYRLCAGKGPADVEPPAAGENGA